MRSVKSLDDFLEQCNDEERQVVELVRHELGLYPEVRTKLSYGVPYFYRNRRIAFVWPASAAFGPKHGVLIGFCFGSQLIDHDALLQLGDRRQVSWLHVQTRDEVPIPALRNFLAQAMMIDDAFGSAKSRTKPSKVVRPSKKTS